MADQNAVPLNTTLSPEPPSHMDLFPTSQGFKIDAPKIYPRADYPVKSYFSLLTVYWHDTVLQWVSVMGAFLALVKTIYMITTHEEFLMTWIVSCLFMYHVTSLFHCTLRWKSQEYKNWIWIPRYGFMSILCLFTCTHWWIVILTILGSCAVAILYYHHQRETYFDIAVGIMSVEFFVKFPLLFTAWGTIIAIDFISHSEKISYIAKTIFFIGLVIWFV